MITGPRVESANKKTAPQAYTKGESLLDTYCTCIILYFMQDRETLPQDHGTLTWW